MCRAGAVDPLSRGAGRESGSTAQALLTEMRRRPLHLESHEGHSWTDFIRLPLRMQIEAGWTQSSQAQLSNGTDSSLGLPLGLEPVKDPCEGTAQRG